MNQNEIFAYDAESDSLSVLKLSSKEKEFSFYLNDKGSLHKVYEEELVSYDTCVDYLDPFFKLVYFESRDGCLEFRKNAIKARMDRERVEILMHTLSLEMYTKWLEKDIS